MSFPEVAVVGAGLSGLSAAALLAREGMKAVVIEEGQDIGGRLRSLDRDGFRLDAGLHCFHFGRSGPIGDLNQSLELGLNFLECSGESYLLRGKDRFLTPSAEPGPDEPGAGSTAEEFGRIREFFGKLIAADPSEWEKKTLAEFMAESGCGDDEVVSGYAAGLCLTILGRSPGETAAGLVIAHARAAGEPGFPVATIAGGPGRLIESLSSRLSRDQARIVLGTRVLGIELRPGRPARVTTSAEEFEAGAVIYTGPVQNLPALLSGEDLPGAFLRTCRRMIPVPGIALELGLSAPVSELRGVMIDPAESVIARFPSNLDPSLAPEGCQLSSWLALVPGDDLDDVKLTRSHLRRLKRMAERQFPQLPELVKWERLRVIPMVAAAAPLPSQLTSRRPRVTMKKGFNLFLAGDGVAGKGLLSAAAVSSAREAAARVKELLGGAGGEARPPGE